MKIEELRKKSEKELKKMLLEKRERLRSLSFDLAQGRLKDTSQIKKTEKDIARILTILCQKEN